MILRTFTFAAVFTFKFTFICLITKTRRNTFSSSCHSLVLTFQFTNENTILWIKNRWFLWIKSKVWIDWGLLAKLQVITNETIYRDTFWKSGESENISSAILPSLLNCYWDFYSTARCAKISSFSHIMESVLRCRVRAFTFLFFYLSVLRKSLTFIFICDFHVDRRTLGRQFVEIMIETRERICGEWGWLLLQTHTQLKVDDLRR